MPKSTQSQYAVREDLKTQRTKAEMELRKLADVPSTSASEQRKVIYERVVRRADKTLGDRKKKKTAPQISVGDLADKIRSMSPGASNKKLRDATGD